MSLKRHVVLIAVWAWSLAGLRPLSAQEPPGAERELMQAHRARYAALVAQDISALAPMLADEFEYCNSAGQVQTKEAYLDAVRSGRPRWLDVSEAAVTAHVYGTAAIVIGQTVPKVQSGTAPPTEIPHRTIEVWVHREGRWRMTQYQATIVREAP